MQTHIDKLIKLFKDLENIAGEDYRKVFNRIELKKGSFLLKEGDICRNNWLLESGLARVFSMKNNIEVTSYFAFSGEFVDSFRSYILRIPSRESIQLLEDSVLFALKRSDIELLRKKYPQISEIERLIAEMYAIWLEDRIYSLQFSTAKERYQELLKNQPRFIQKIPLTYLASYLGITLETLSRIRSKT